MFKTTRKPKKTALRPEGVRTPARTAPPAAAEPARAPAPRTSRVSLELVQPGAREVFVAGSFNEWKPDRTPLLHRGNGHWVGDLAVEAGRYEYMFVVDGQWLPDPNAKESVQNPFGGKNSLLVVSN
ncbi:MAG: glycogen-binding domain-containing protein [Limisphaerales bacterium]